MAHIFPEEFSQTSINETNHDSRYDEVPRFNQGNLQVLLGWKDAVIKPHSDDLVHMVSVKDSDRLDLIAYEYYENVKWWWVIAKRNDISNPRRVPVGSTLYIPSLEQVLSLEWAKHRVD